MKILVTGATGFLGTKLLRSLAADGHTLVALTRSPTKAREKVAVPCTFFPWEAETEVPPAEAFVDVDAVVNLAGEGVADGRWTPVRKRQIQASRLRGTRHLLQAIAKMPKKPHVLVSASAIGYYGDRADEVLTENSAPGTGFLAELCQDWEAAAWEGALPETRRVIVRIGVVLGVESGALAKLLPIFRSGVGGPVGSGRQWMSWIHVDDVVALLHHAVVDPRCTGVLNATAPEPVTNERFSKELGLALGRPALLRAPSRAVKFVFGEMASMVLASQHVVPERTLATGFRFRFPYLVPALRHLCDDKRRGHEVVRFEQWIPRPVDEVFAFFSDAKNLEAITPPWLHFRMLSQSQPQLGSGTLIDYKLRVHGLPIEWRTRIEDWEPGKHFVDTQLRGPYALWHHTHEFLPVGTGTLMRDTVRYRLPLGMAGRWIALWRVRRDVDAIFRFRHGAIVSRFGK